MKVVFFQFKVLKVAKSSTKVIFIIISVADPKLHYVPNIWHKLQKCQKRGGTVKFEVCIQALFTG